MLEEKRGFQDEIHTEKLDIRALEKVWQDYIMGGDPDVWDYVSP